MVDVILINPEFKHEYNIPSAEPYISMGSVSRTTSYPMITILGSKKFIDDIRLVEAMLIHAGWNVFAYGGMECDESEMIMTEERTIYYTAADCARMDRPKHFQMIDEIWRERILMSRAVYVVNRDDHIGETTRKLIEFAKSNGLEVFYMQHHREKKKG